MIKGIIFDLDGTLCDTLEDIRTGVNAVLKRLGYGERSLKEIHSFINNGSRQLIKRSLPDDVQSVDFIVDSALSDYDVEYSKCYCDKTHIFNGIAEILDELKTLGFKIAILSNKQDAFVRGIADKLFEARIFDCVMGQSEFPTKPNPASALYVAKMIGAKPEACIYVGDSDVDVATAKNAGMKFIGVKWGYRDEETLKQAGAEIIAANPQELMQEILRLNSEN